ncbi:MAG: TIM-barrel domain-containing protein [Gemmatimonadota bacterium]
MRTTDTLNKALQARFLCTVAVGVLLSILHTPPVAAIHVPEAVDGPSCAEACPGGSANPILYAGQPAELIVFRVSDRTFEVRISPLGPGGEPVSAPSSEVLIDHSREELWRGRTLDAPVERQVGALTVEVRGDPLTVVVRREDGAIVQELVWASEDGAMRFSTPAPVFGMGEGGGQYDRRGHLHTMRDGNAAYERATHGAHVAVPMLIGTDGWSLFVHHPINRGNEFDLRDGRTGTFRPGGDAHEEQLRLYLTAWDEPSEALAEYQVIAGQAAMPPRWALGYMQSHRTLTGPDEIRWVANELRSRRLPTDALIYLGSGFTPSGWNHGHGTWQFNEDVFDDPANIIQDLHDLDFRVVLHVYSPPSGLHGESVTATATDESHVAQYWGLHRPIFELGVDGWWPDGGENLASESRVARHRMYVEGPLAERPGVRPWSLHRTGYSGVHRYGGWIWSGDPDSRWSTLETHVPIGLNHSVSVSPFWGSDVAGFVPTHELTGELYIRWFQFAAFTPSFRSHGRTWHLRLPWGWNRGHIGNPESSIFEREGGYPNPAELRNALIEPIAREYLNLRYRLLPYNYTLAREAHDTGLPPMRAMWLHYPDDGQAVATGDQYLWGRDLLVAPVYARGANQRALYLPEGDWYDFWTGERVEGGERIWRQVDLATLPLYVRAGAILPLDPVRQHTREVVEEPTTIRIYPGADGEYRWYRDDGETLAYREGAYSWTRLTWDDGARRLVIEPDPDSAGEPPTGVTLRLQLMPEGTYRTVEWDGTRTEFEL